MIYIYNLYLLTIHKIVILSVIPIKISELFKLSILNLDEFFISYPTDFGNEFNEARHSYKNITSSNYVKNVSLNHSTNYFNTNYSSKYQTSSS